MFGVDATGKDILTPQFSKDPQSARKSPGMIPGSGLDYEIRLNSEIKRLSDSEAFINIIRERVLYEMFEKGDIALPIEYSEQARNELISERYTARMANFERLLASNNNRFDILLTINPDAILQEKTIQQQINDRNREKESKRTQKELSEQLTMDHPDVIRRALLRIYIEGLLFVHSSKIETLVQNKIEEIAAKNARDAVYEEAVSASRSAVLRTRG